MDIDNDGKGDLLSGSYSPGHLYVFRGLGGGKFAEAEPLKGADGKELVPGHASTVHAVDWDGDGDLDLICGNIKGQVYFIPNQGSAAEPKFGNKVRVEAGGKPLVAPHGDSGPVVVDWDGDGTLDLLVGCGDGSVVFCRGTGEGKGKAPMLAAPETLVEKSKSIGIRAKICPVDWNSDGKLDLLVGTYGRENVGKKATGEDGKRLLAEVIKKRDKAMTEYRKIFGEICAKATNTPDWKTGMRPKNKEQWEQVKKFMDKGGELVDRYKASQNEVRNLMQEISRMRGIPKSVGKVWLFTRS